MGFFTCNLFVFQYLTRISLISFRLFLATIAHYHRWSNKKLLIMNNTDYNNMSKSFLAATGSSKVGKSIEHY